MADLPLPLPAVAPPLPAPPGPLVEFWRYFRENRGAVAGLAFMTGLVFVAVFADVIAPHSPIEQFRDRLLEPPVWQNGGSSAFLLGTDAVGRDMLSRIIFGARYSLFIGAVVVSDLSIAFAAWLAVPVIVHLVLLVLALRRDEAEPTEPAALRAAA